MVMASWHVEGGSKTVASGWLSVPPVELDLGSTLGCGQAFRWKQLHRANADDALAWRAVVRRRVLTVWREGERVGAQMEPGPFDEALLDHYFDLRLDLPAVCRSIARDDAIQAALDRYPGLRILQQEPWETLIAFLLSQFSNVPRIAGQMEALSSAYGSLVAHGLYSFPSPTQLASATEKELRDLGLGYRAPYIETAARRCAETGTAWLDVLANLSYRQARDRIVLPVGPGGEGDKVLGVGPKVADCVLLFSLGHYEAFPVDVHVRRAMEALYGHQAQLTSRYDSVGDFGRSYFGQFAGYAQQYLFHRQRITSREKRSAQIRSKRGSQSATSSGTGDGTGRPRSSSSAAAAR